MKPIEIAKDIYWVGAVDWNIRDMHGYLTPHGTTYNAFLVVDEKIALIDTTKKGFVDELIHSISQIVEPKRSTVPSAITRKWIIQGACQGSCTELGKISPCIVLKWV